MQRIPGSRWGGPGARSGVRGSGWCPVSRPAGGGAGSMRGCGQREPQVAVGPSLARRGVFGGPGGDSGSRCGWPVPALGHLSSRSLFLCPRVSPCLVWPLMTIPISSPLQTLCPRVARAEGLVGEPTGLGSSGSCSFSRPLFSSGESSHSTSPVHSAAPRAGGRGGGSRRGPNTVQKPEARAPWGPWRRRAESRLRAAPEPTLSRPCGQGEDARVSSGGQSRVPRCPAGRLGRRARPWPLRSASLRPRPRQGPRPCLGAGCLGPASLQSPCCAGRA